MKNSIDNLPLPLLVENYRFLRHSFDAPSIWNWQRTKNGERPFAHVTPNRNVPRIIFCIFSFEFFTCMHDVCRAKKLTIQFTELLFLLIFFNSIVVVIVRPDTKIPCISTQRQIRAGANSRNTAPTSVRALTLNYADARDWNIGCVVIINNQKHSACIRTMNTVGSGCVFCVCDQPLKSILPQGNRHLPNSYTTTTTAAAAAGDNKIFLIQI